MYKCIVIVFTLFVNSIVFLATSFWTNVGDSADNSAYNEKVAYYEEVLGVDMEFVCRVSGEHAGRREGMLKYMNDSFEYYYDDEQDYLASIIYLGASNTTNTKELSSEEVQPLVEKLFEKVMGQHVVGDLHYELTGDQGIYYTFTCAELVDGFETGTSALFLIDKYGTLNLASFTLGNQYDFYPEEMLTEQEAFELTTAYLKDIEEREPIWNLYYSEIISWRGVSVWEIVVEASQDDFGYLVRLDVYTGEVLYCEFCMF